MFLAFVAHATFTNADTSRLLTLYSDVGQHLKAKALKHTVIAEIRICIIQYTSDRIGNELGLHFDRFCLDIYLLLIT